MSEKHLTEKLWKDLAAKQGVKDIGLQKALAAHEKIDAAKEPGRALDGLREISELALKLKKACSAKADVVGHLDEVLKEVKKIAPALETRVKAAAPAAVSKAPEPKAAGGDDSEEEEAEAEAEAFKKDLKQQMVGALAQVKIRAPGDSKPAEESKPQLHFMAYLASKASAVIIAKKVGGATKKLLPEIAGAGDGKFFSGECIFENNAHTFVLETVPGGLAKKLAAALHAGTGMKYKVRARSADGSTVLDSDTDLEPGVAEPPVPPPAPEPPRATAPKPPVAPPPPAAAAAPPAAPREIKLSTYLSGRKNLRAARENAEKELNRLQEVILTKAASEPFFKEVESKSRKLFDYLAPIDDAVANKLDDAGRCVDPEEQAEKNLEVRRLIQKQLSSLRGHPLASFIEKNPFGSFGVRQPLEETLTALDKQLS